MTEVNIATATPTTAIRQLLADFVCFYEGGRTASINALVVTSLGRERPSFSCVAEPSHASPVFH